VKGGALRYGLQIERTLQFMIERKVADVDVCIDDGSVRTAGAFEAEVSTSFDRKAIGRDLVDVSQIQIISSYVQTKDAGAWIVSGTARNNGIVVKEMNIIECEFAVREMESRIKLLNRLAIG
jgi:hypothetical protein